MIKKTYEYHANRVVCEDHLEEDCFHAHYHCYLAASMHLKGVMLRHEKVAHCILGQSGLVHEHFFRKFEKSIKNNPDYRFPKQKYLGMIDSNLSNESNFILAWTSLLM